MPEPTTKQELKSLLGFVNYLSKFLPKLSEVAQPLRDLTAKEAKFIWSTQHAKSFKEIRELVVEHPVLKYYDPSEEATIQCDASEVGLGAALMQNGQPVAFASRTLSQTERQYAQIEKECLAIVFACDKFTRQSVHSRTRQDNCGVRSQALRVHTSEVSPFNTMRVTENAVKASALQHSSSVQA